ncbi:hypothetical protein [Nocardia africana]|uniref:Uncharacterized protein n=1 Tax=Nocardia africana TaxID=134964 RepID=A0A378WWZ1_9NOCA|nr:hypothetical protein [Nocardia africana]MCC3313685.1 hypothetical protein [Nocardia africana]SUA44934.1 Uncharacterised protein [Nocardia africana]
MMTMGEVPHHTVVVSVTALSPLILAVHAVAADGALARRWRYDNVIDVAVATVTDLDSAVAQHRHRRERTPLAAIAITRYRSTVDVLFERSSEQALAYFCGSRGTCATLDARREYAWALFLAEHTANYLAAVGIHSNLH